MKNKTKFLTFIAISVALNIVGSKIAILLNLPIFLDSIGTIMAGMILGPVGGMIAGIVGGCMNGILGDIYSFYFSISGVLMGVLSGFILHGKKVSKPSLLWRTAAISVPASFVSSIIEVVLFGGVTTALWTTTLINILSHSVMNLFGSAFVVQVCTDYVDKFIAVALVVAVYKHLPVQYKEFKNER